MTRDRVFELIQDCYHNLHSSGLIPESITVDDDTVLLGAGTLLDSITFVTFMVELEDRLTQEHGSELSIFSMAIDQLHEFNPTKSQLSAATLAEFVAKVTSSGSDG